MALLRGASGLARGRVRAWGLGCALAAGLASPKAARAQAVEEPRVATPRASTSETPTTPPEPPNRWRIVAQRPGQFRISGGLIFGGGSFLRSTNLRSAGLVAVELQGVVQLTPSLMLGGFAQIGSLVADSVPDVTNDNPSFQRSAFAAVFQVTAPRVFREREPSSVFEAAGGYLGFAMFRDHAYAISEVGAMPPQMGPTMPRGPQFLMGATTTVQSRLAAVEARVEYGFDAFDNGSPMTLLLQVALHFGVGF